MSWCPKCKIEYVSGIEKCKECGSELVEFMTEDEYKKSKSELDQSRVKRIEPRLSYSKINKIALTLKILAGIFLLLGLVFSIYGVFDYWLQVKEYGLMDYNRGALFQQFITMFGRCVVSSIVIYALGEGLQILHDIRSKIYENK